MNFFFLIITTIILFSKKKSPSLINSFKKMVIRIAIISFIKGIVFTTIFWINYYYYNYKFTGDCPFNFSLQKTEKLINKTKIENYGKSCEFKRCIFNSSSITNTETNDDLNTNINYNYNYLCNFIPTYDVKYNKNNNIKCEYVTKKNFIDTKFYYYLDKCDKYSNYYSCNSKEKRHDKFFVKYNHNCNKSLKKNRYIALGYLFPFIDVISDLTIWLFIYYQYKVIIKYITYVNIAALTRYSSASLNSTKESSVIKPNNNNRDLITQINIHNQTETIFYPPLDDNRNKNKNINNINIDNIISNNETTINIEDNKNNSSFDSKVDIISSRMSLDNSTEV